MQKFKPMPGYLIIEKVPVDKNIYTGEINQKNGVVFAGESEFIKKGDLVHFTKQTCDLNDRLFVVSEEDVIVIES